MKIYTLHLILGYLLDFNLPLALLFLSLIHPLFLVSWRIWSSKSFYSIKDWMGALTHHRISECRHTFWNFLLSSLSLQRDYFYPMPIKSRPSTTEKTSNYHFLHFVNLICFGYVIPFTTMYRPLIRKKAVTWLNTCHPVLNYYPFISLLMYSLIYRS